HELRIVPAGETTAALVLDLRDLCATTTVYYASGNLYASLIVERLSPSAVRGSGTLAAVDELANARLDVTGLADTTNLEVELIFQGGRRVYVTRANLDAAANAQARKQRANLDAAANAQTRRQPQMAREPSPVVSLAPPELFSEAVSYRIPQD